MGNHQSIQKLILNLSQKPILVYDDSKNFLKPNCLLINSNKFHKLSGFIDKTINPNFENYKTLVSFGSNQSNAMLALSVLAKKFDRQFIYYTKFLPKTIITNSNLDIAIKNGIKIITSKDYTRDFYALNPKINLNDTFYFYEGVASRYARVGYEKFAKTLFTTTANLKNKVYLISCGTGLGAYLLATYLNKIDSSSKFIFYSTVTKSKVDFINTVKKLLKDINYLSKISFSFKFYLLSAPSFRKFGKLNLDYYALYQDLKTRTNFKFDLLYDIPCLLALKHNLQSNILKNRNIIFISQGGLNANISLIPRYIAKFNIK